MATVPSTGAVKFYNSILWGNGGSPLDLAGSGTATFTSCVVEGGAAGANNLSLNPKLVSTDNGDLHLTSTSPAINNGDNSLTPSSALTVDLDSNPRIFGTALDMGAYEYQN